MYKQCHWVCWLVANAPLFYCSQGAPPSAHWKASGPPASPPEEPAGDQETLAGVIGAEPPGEIAAKPAGMEADAAAARQRMAEACQEPQQRAAGHEAGPVCQPPVQMPPDWNSDE